MRRWKKKNEGFTLVEVVVSMLILSIIMVSVLSAYTSSAKNNVRNKSIQNATTLLENLVEFASAGGGEEKSPYQNYFAGTEEATVITDPSNPNISVITLKGVAQGTSRFNVKITRDLNSDKYKDSINKKEVISLGAGGKRAIMIDLSEKGCDKDGDNINNYDQDFLNDVYNFYDGNLKNINYLREADEQIPVQSKEEFKSMIGRVLDIRKENLPSSKYKLNAFVCYELDSSKLTLTADINKDGTINQADKDLLLSPAQCKHEMQIAASEELSASTVTEATAIKLSSVYILYNESSIAKNSPKADIIINDPDLDIEANFFVVIQDGSNMSDSAVVTNGKKGTGYSDEQMLMKRISSEAKVIYRYSSSEPSQSDYQVGIFCSGNLSVFAGKEGYESKVSATNPKEQWLKIAPNKLVATQATAKIVETKIEVIDPSTNSVVKTGETVFLR